MMTEDGIKIGDKIKAKGDKIKVKAEWQPYYGKEVILLSYIPDMYIFAHVGEKEASLFMPANVVEDYLILENKNIC